MPQFNFQIKPYLLENQIQHYAWGTRGEQAFIPRFLGIKTEENKPYAELWIGAHPKAPSIVTEADARIPLNELTNLYPKEILGQEAARTFNNQLPFLFKILSAGEALSIQAHPSKSQAVKLHQQDPRNYPDDNHKPEIAIALDDLTAMAGFRNFEELQECLQKYPHLASFAGEQISKVYKAGSANNSGYEDEFVYLLYSQVMQKSLLHPEELSACLKALNRQIKNLAVKDEREELYLQLYQKYGDDPGLFSLFLLNLIHLSAGQGLFLAAGMPHAYLKGNIIECMANSDNVIRAGLTPKFKDIETLIEVLNYNPGDLEILGRDSCSDICNYEVPIPEFYLSKISFGGQKKTEISNASVQIILVLAGSVSLKWDAETAEYKKGQSILIPAALNMLEISGSKDAALYTAQVPV